ncbi:hypothetical protein HDU86_007775 [Geranomyces michiganensis]|nr:hypothetical protein HDU86_007775 [Geranomyces michiganensis]
MLLPHLQISSHVALPIALSSAEHEEYINQLHLGGGKLQLIGFGRSDVQDQFGVAGVIVELVFEA